MRPWLALGLSQARFDGLPEVELVQKGPLQVAGLEAGVPGLPRVHDAMDEARQEVVKRAGQAAADAVWAQHVQDRDTSRYRAGVSTRRTQELVGAGARSLMGNCLSKAMM